jgi:hypothetical protein
MKTDYSITIPPRTLESLRRYADFGVPTGSFLRAVLCNDLFGTYDRADNENRAAIGAILQYVYNEMPANCWGSREVYHQWMATKQAANGVGGKWAGEAFA